MNSCMRFRVRIKVDLPQPDGPIRAVTVPAAKSSDTSERTCLVPNHAWTPRVSRPVPNKLLPGTRCSRLPATDASDDGVVVCIFFSMPLSLFEFSIDDISANLSSTEITCQAKQENNQDEQNQHSTPCSCICLFRSAC